MKGAIKNISIQGFKSIRELEPFTFNNLNVFIGANGAGKSNLVQLFRLLMAMTRKTSSNSYWKMAARTVFCTMARNKRKPSRLNWNFNHIAVLRKTRILSFRADAYRG